MSDLENTSNNEAVNPNDALCTIEMINYQGAREEIDIWGQLDIYESMYDQTVHGSVMIFDGAGFEERFPIVGQEFIYITYKSQSKSGLKVERVYHIIKMSETMIDERRMVYNLYFSNLFSQSFIELFNSISLTNTIQFNSLFNFNNLLFRNSNLLKLFSNSLLQL